jgi:hypothetical protein
MTLIGVRFATDSPVERAGFELPVPGEGAGFELSVPP